MSEVQNKQAKQPMGPNKKQLLKRILTFVGGGVGIALLIVFGIVILQPTPKVHFKGIGVFIEDLNINSDGTIENVEDPKRNGYDFLGWYDNEDFSGNPINLEEHKFLELRKQFRWFGKEEKLPVTTSLFAKWELHKYQIEVLDDETKEPIIIYDEDNTPIEDIEFYVTAVIVRDDEKEQFIKDYMDNVITESSTEEEKKAAETEAGTIARAPELQISQIWNFHHFNDIEDIEFVDADGEILEPIDRSKLEVKYDEDGNELPVLTVYVKNYTK